VTDAGAISIPGLTIPDVVSGYAHRQPHAEAIVCAEQRLTWAEFVNAYHRAANALIAHGLHKGDKVALLMHNSIEMAVLIMAVVKAGGVLVPLSPLFDGAALARMIERADVDYLFATQDNLATIVGQPQMLHSLREGGNIAVDFHAPGWLHYEAFTADASADDPGVTLCLDDVFNIMFTSGTTGDPKGAVHSHLSRLLYPLGWGAALGIDRNATALLATPLYHNGTWITMLSALHHGGKVVILPKFDAAQFMQLVASERCTHSFVVPSQLIVIMQLDNFASYDTTSLEVVLTSGSPLPSSTFAAVQRGFAHSDLLELYGMSEGFCTVIDRKDYARGKAGTVGRPLHFLNTDVQLIDANDRVVGAGEIGEIVGTSALLMNGYYKDPQRTAQSLWRDHKGRDYLRSGDLGRIDADGYLSIVGRSKDMIISGGINVFPIDIEEVFMQHDEVSEVAVIGVPHEKWGETPLLLALMKDGATSSEAALMAWGNDKLSGYQRVCDVEFREAFPRNALDKILKRELREPYWTGRDSELV
jgi:long-chain acyl-CoA synthetase